MQGAKAKQDVIGRINAKSVVAKMESLDRFGKLSKQIRRTSIIK